MRIWNGDFGRPEPQDSAEGKPKSLRVMIQKSLAVSCAKQSTNMTSELPHGPHNTSARPHDVSRWFTGDVVFSGDVFSGDTLSYPQIFRGSAATDSSCLL